jgi:hypothetical protein
MFRADEDDDQMHDDHQNARPGGGERARLDDDFSALIRRPVRKGRGFFIV